jgi:dTMP kinase
MLPSFFLATLGGVIVDRFDRRKVMVICDVARAGLIVILPFADSLFVLVLVSFAIEILTLLWGPAKDASVPHFLGTEQLASANWLSLVASYGTFPLGAGIFAVLAVVATWIGGFHAFSALKVDREVIALWVDAATYVTSALIVLRLPIPRGGRQGARLDWTQSIREIKEGLSFIKGDRLVRAVILGMGGGIIGAGAMVPLGIVFAREVLGSSAQWGVLMIALGTGAAIGIFSLLALQKRLPRESLFGWAVVGVGGFLALAATFNVAGLASLMIAACGACAGTSYVTGFTILQEHVSDELRGRTFATLYTVVRLCLLISLTVSPLFADVYEWIFSLVEADNRITLGGFSYAFPGVRLALWGGSVLTIVSGLYARRQMSRLQPAPAPAAEPQPPEAAADP